MSKQFHSYTDILEEKKRLEVLLQAQRQVIRNDVEELKASLQPMRDAAVFIRKLTTKDKTSVLLNVGSDLLINSLVKKFILARAGWFTRIVLPYFLKNYSSHFLAEQKEKWFDKLAAWISHKNGKEHMKEKEKEEEGGGDGGKDELD